MLSSLAQQDGWTPLFNGNNLQGWQQLNGKAKYTVHNGVIVGETVYGEPNSFLITGKTPQPTTSTKETSAMNVNTNNN